MRYDPAILKEEGRTSSEGVNTASGQEGKEQRILIFLSACYGPGSDLGVLYIFILIVPYNHSVRLTSSQINGWDTKIHGQKAGLRASELVK